METTTAVSVLFAVSIACAGCVSQAGPVVRDVRQAPDGRIYVERCDLVLSYGYAVPSPSFEECAWGPPSR